MNKDVATQGEDLGIGKPMQIRAVPEKVRRYWNDLAYGSRQTLGEYFTSYSLKMMENGGPHTMVDTVAPSAPALPRLDQLCMAMEACERAANIKSADRSRNSREVIVANHILGMLGQQLKALTADATAVTVVPGKAP